MPSVLFFSEGHGAVTDQEKRLHRAQLLIDIEDAEKELAYSRDKAATVAREHENISDAIRRNIEIDPSQADFTVDGEVANRLTPTQITFEGGQTAAALIAEMRRARRNLFDLYERRRKLPLA